MYLAPATPTFFQLRRALHAECRERACWNRSGHPDRALEPLDGIKLMQRHRKTSQLLNLTSGPGASRRFSNRSPPRRSRPLRPGPLWLGKTGRPTGPIGKTVASAFRAPPTRSFVFTSAGIPSLVDRAAPSPRRAQKIVYRIKVIAVEIALSLPCSNSSRFFFAHCCSAYFLLRVLSCVSRVPSRRSR